MHENSALLTTNCEVPTPHGSRSTSLPNGVNESHALKIVHQYVTGAKVSDTQHRVQMIQRDVVVSLISQNHAAQLGQSRVHTPEWCKKLTVICFSWFLS